MPLNRGVADKLGETLLLLYQCDSGVFTTRMKIHEITAKGMPESR